MHAIAFVVVTIFTNCYEVFEIDTSFADPNGNIHNNTKHPVVAAPLLEDHTCFENPIAIAMGHQHAL